MVINIDEVVNEFKNNRKLCDGFNAYEKYVNFRFNYIIRASLVHPPDEVNPNGDYSAFDPSQESLLAYINSTKDEKNITKLREEYKKLVSELNTKKKEVHIVTLQEEGVRNNIKQLEEIIAIKEKFIEETANYAQIRCDAKNKVQKEYNKVYKKYNSVLSQLYKSSKASSKTNSSNGSNKHIEYLNDKVNRYEAKIKKMNEVIKIASESKNKLEQYQTALQTSKDRLKTFYEQLNSNVNYKQEITSFINSKEKLVKQLKLNLSNLGVLSSVDKSRQHVSPNCIENNNIKQEFADLQKMRNEVLNSRPKGMFNPKYQKDKTSLSKEEIRRYLENVEAIDSIDYLIELKNIENNSDTSLLKYVRTYSNETNIFIRCMATLSTEEVKKLLVHYFTKNVDLKQSVHESDDIIAELDESINRYKRTILNINNNFQEFHLSIEKKFAILKKNYQDKVNSLFAIFQEESNAITVLKLKQEVLNLKKKIIELEKEKSLLAKSKMVTVLSEQQYLEHLEASRSGSETVSGATVPVKKNKLKIKKNKSKK